MPRRHGASKRLYLLWKACKKFDQDHGFFLSAGITFSLLICLIPLILLLLALLGKYLYSSRDVLNHIGQYLERVVPPLDPRIMRNVLRITEDRNIVGMVGMGGLIWTSTWVFSSLRMALNIVFQVEKGRGILHGKAIDLLMIFLAGVSLLVSMVLTSGITVLQGFQLQNMIDLAPFIQWILKYVLAIFFTYGMFVLIYTIIPNRKIRLRAALTAAFFTTLMWEVTKHLFGWYVVHLGRFSVVYGSLSTVAIFFLWLYYSSAILLLGGEFAFILHGEQDSQDLRRMKRHVVVT